MNDLRDRVALVTGASRGIGAGIAIALAKAGANVALNYRQTAGARGLCSLITAMGGTAVAIQADKRRDQAHNCRS